MPIKPRTVITSALALVAIVGAGYFAFRPEAVPVDMVVAERAPMRQTVDADGKTRIKDIYEVSAPISGTAQRSPVEVGDLVAEGTTVVAVVQPLATGFLDTRARSQAEAAVLEAEAGLRVAESTLRQAREELNYAQSQHARVKALVSRGVSSLTQLEDAAQQQTLREAALESAVLNRDMAESALARSRAALIEPGESGAVIDDEGCCVSITAPVDGVVLDIVNVSERPVQAGTKLLSIGEPGNLEIVADILSADAVSIEPGARVLVERWGGGDRLEAEVRKIEPSAYTKVSALGIEEQRVDVTFDFVDGEIAGRKLGDGYAVFVRVITWEGDGVLQVPISTLFRNNGGWALFAAEGGVARQYTVEVGRRSGLMAEITSGIEPGLQVITHPSDRVADGVQVVNRQEL